MSQQVEVSKNGIRSQVAQLGGGSWSNSRTWRSDSHVITWDWKRAEANLRRMRLDRSAVIPQSLAEYVLHKREIHEIYSEELKERAEAKETQKTADAVAAEREPIPAIVFEGFTDAFAQNLQEQFALESIFSPHWTPPPDREVAPWPSMEEYKEEGDERHTSGFGRFLPIPRVAGNPTVTWKQKSFQHAYPKDAVRPVAKLYDFLQLPNDYQVVEPTMDEDCHILDCEWESGREAEAATKATWPVSGLRRSVSSLPNNPDELFAFQERHHEWLAENTSTAAQTSKATGSPLPRVRPTRAQSAHPIFREHPLRQLNPDAAEFKSRVSSGSSDTGSSASFYSGVAMKATGDQQARSRLSIQSGSSSNSSVYGAPLKLSNPYSALSGAENENSDSPNRFDAPSSGNGGVRMTRHASSKSISELHTADWVDQEPTPRRSSFGPSFPVAQRSMYGRSSFSKHDAIFENVPKKYSKGFDEDEHEYCPVTPKAQRHSGLAPGSAPRSGSRAGSNPGSAFNSPAGSMPGSGAHSRNVSPMTRPKVEAAAAGAELEKDREAWASLAMTMRGLDL